MEDRVKKALEIKTDDVLVFCSRDILGCMQALAMAVEAKDYYTRWHSKNVSYCTVKIAENLFCLGFDTNRINDIKVAATLHDIGKISISDYIISKPHKLTNEEYEIVKTHPAHALRILSPLGLPKNILDAIYQHHERYDGSGYPCGLKGEEISLEARVISVADSIDAMMSERPYRHQNISLNRDVVEELKKYSGKQFDPLVAKVAIYLIENNELTMEDFSLNIP